MTIFNFFAQKTFKCKKKTTIMNVHVKKIYIDKNKIVR